MSSIVRLALNVAAFLFLSAVAIVSLAFMTGVIVAATS